jgi:hypothetical protein
MAALPALGPTERSGETSTLVRPGVVTPLINDDFKGELIFFVRDPALPTTASGPGKRYWELQVQGRFRRPVENFFMGMELSEALKMTFFMRGVASTLLSFVKTFESDIHTSFGAGKTAETAELPHLVTPIFKGVDAVVETVDGTGEPPTLGSDLLSGPKRPKSERPQSARLDATYTFSVFSTFLDLFAWKIKGMPAVGSVDMHGFFKDAALRIIAYSCAPTRQRPTRPWPTRPRPTRQSAGPHLRPRV